MILEAIKAQHYTPYRHFIQAVPAGHDRPTLDLPHHLQWLNSNNPAYLLAVLERYLTRKGINVTCGRDEKGFVLALNNEQGDELLRVTALTNFEAEENWLPIPRTDDLGLWFLAQDLTAERAPFMQPAGQRGAFPELVQALRAWEYFGDDFDEDFAHLGTYVEHSPFRFSRVTEYFSAGANILAISYREVQPPHAIANELTETIDRALTDIPKLAILRTLVGSQREQHYTHFFDADDHERAYGEMAVEDALVVVSQSSAEEGQPIGSYAQAQHDYLLPQLQLLTAGDDLVARVSKALIDVPTYRILQIIQDPQTPYLTLRVAVSDSPLLFNVQIRK